MLWYHIKLSDMKVSTKHRLDPWLFGTTTTMKLNYPPISGLFGTTSTKYTIPFLLLQNHPQTSGLFTSTTTVNTRKERAPEYNAHPNIKRIEF